MSSEAEDDDNNNDDDYDHDHDYDYDANEESFPKAPTSLVINPVYDAYTDTDYKAQNSIMQPYNQSGSFFVKVCALTSVHM